MTLNSYKAMDPSKIIKFLDSPEKAGFTPIGERRLPYTTRINVKHQQQQEERRLLSAPAPTMDPNLTLSSFMTDNLEYTTGSGAGRGFTSSAGRNGSNELNRDSTLTFGSHVVGRASMSSTMGREVPPLNSSVAKSLFGAEDKVSNIAVGVSPAKRSSLGITMEREDTERVFNVPVSAKDIAGVAVEEARFRYGFLTKPKVTPVEAPPLYRPESDFLMPCKLRREHHEYEVKQMHAARLLHKARAQEARKEYLMKTRHSTGVLGVDSPFTYDTAAYTEAAESRAREHHRKSVSHRERRERLSALTVSEERLGYKLLSHTREPPKPKDAKIFQTKVRVGEAANTFDRFFSHDKTKYDVGRAVQLRDHDHRHKNYNIVTGTALPPMADINALPGWIQVTNAGPRVL